MSNGQAIRTEGLGKTYRSRKQGSTGLRASLKAFVKPEYQEVQAVAGVDLRLGSGEIRALIGPNGAGKSTLIKMLCGILHPSYGSVECLGMEPWKHREEYVRRIGAVFGQKTQLMWDLPASDSFLINKQVYRISDAVYKRSMDYFEERFGLSQFKERAVRNLSLGERMRCELVAALLHEPSLVFLDEPTIGMDILAKDMVRQFVRDVNRERGVTFILTTHDLGDVENLCEKISVINQGKVVFDGEQSELKQSLGGKKRLELSFNRPLTEAELSRATEEGARFTPTDLGHVLAASWELSGSGAASSAMAASLMVNYPTADIGVRDPDIEEVIRQLYQGVK